MLSAVGRALATPFRSLTKGRTSGRGVSSDKEEQDPSVDGEGFEHRPVPVRQQEREDSPVVVGRNLREELDEKYGIGDDADSESVVVLSSVNRDAVHVGNRQSKMDIELLSQRKYLPKIEYRKLTMLTLENFDAYRENIERLGYAREWQREFFRPTPKELNDHVWDPALRGESLLGAVIRKEAFLVLTNTIPQKLKYLIRKVPVGDALGVWAVLFQRFLRSSLISLYKK